MSSSSTLPPYQVVYSELCRAHIKELRARAVERQRLAEIIQTLRAVHLRLQWIPLDFGDPLRDLQHLGLKEYIAVLPPLVVKYGVDEARRIVYVSLPFDLLPQSGL